MREFGTYLRHRRHELELSVEEIAHHLGLSAGRYRQIEAGYSARGLTPAQTVTLADVLQVTVAELIAVEVGQSIGGQP